jgi:hypothetical protein
MNGLTDSSLSSLLQSGEMLLLKFGELSMQTRLMEVECSGTAHSTTAAHRRSTTTAELGQIIGGVGLGSIFRRIRSRRMMSTSTPLPASNSIMSTVSMTVSLGKTVGTSLSLLGVL